VRVVLDTNILISACWTPDGLEAQTVARVVTGSITACVSPAVWSEYQEVLQRPKFTALRPRADEILASLGARVVRVESKDVVTVATDEDDNRFLECAAAAGAAYLITGNLKHYPPAWLGTKIVNAREFLSSSPG